MHNYKIEKNVEAPTGTGHNGRPKIYPFDSMEIGDSFFAENKTANALCSAFRHWRIYNGKMDVKFTTRKEGNGVRCWRVQ